MFGFCLRPNIIKYEFYAEICKKNLKKQISNWKVVLGDKICIIWVFETILSVDWDRQNFVFSDYRLGEYEKDFFEN